VKKVLVIQPIASDALRILHERADISVEVLDDAAPDEVARRICDADAAIIRDAPLPIEVLEAASRLKVISRHGVGYDNIPIAYCTSRKIAVTIVGSGNAISVAEHAMFLLLAAARRGLELDAAVRKGDFDIRNRIHGSELSGRTLLIVGYGRIGREVARRALAFGLKVAVFDPYTSDVGSDVFVARSLEEGLPLADIISLHVPLTGSTHHLIGAAQIALMRPGAIVINTSRGGLIDEEALVAALASGQVSAAGLDTFNQEPLPAESPLVRLSNLILTPHCAALTGEAFLRMGIATVQNVLSALDGTLDPENVVNRDVL
jgi:D-3-phosphoglycerate dehydrogenase / 2-oxoglutarate reductase